MPVPGSPHGSPGIENSGRVSILPIRKSAPKKRIEMALLVQIPPILRRRHRPRSLHNSAQLCITTHENNRTNPKKGGHQGEHKAKPAKLGAPHALEQTVHTHTARQPCRSGGGQSSTAAARRIHPPGGGRNLQLLYRKSVLSG